MFKTGEASIVQCTSMKISIFTISPCIIFVQYTAGVRYIGGCSVHWGDVQYIGGISLSTPEVFSTLKDIMSIPGSVQYSGGIPSVQRGDTMMSVGDIMSTAGVFSTLGGYHDECGRYHEYTRACSENWGFHTNSIVFPMTFPHIYHDLPLVYS